MDCDRFRAVLQDYLDRTLDDDRRAEVEAHAIRCAPCRQILDSYRRVLDAAIGMPAPPAAALGMAPDARPAASQAGRGTLH